MQIFVLHETINWKEKMGNDVAIIQTAGNDQPRLTSGYLNAISS